jgi:glucosamine kinase
LGATRIALMGGMAAPYRPHLSARFDALLVAPAGDALDGALALAGLRQ